MTFLIEPVQPEVAITVAGVGLTVATAIIARLWSANERKVDLVIALHRETLTAMHSVQEALKDLAAEIRRLSP